MCAWLESRAATWAPAAGMGAEFSPDHLATTSHPQSLWSFLSPCEVLVSCQGQASPWPSAGLVPHCKCVGTACAVNGRSQPVPLPNPSPAHRRFGVRGRQQGSLQTMVCLPLLPRTALRKHQYHPPSAPPLLLPPHSERQAFHLRFCLGTQKRRQKAREEHHGFRPWYPPPPG